MHKYITRACVAAAASVALSTVGVTGVSASAAAPQLLGLSLGGTSHATASPGTQLWVKRYNSGIGGPGVAASVAASPSGNTVFVTGQALNAAGTGTDYVTVAYAATGAQVWAKRYFSPGTGEDKANSVAVSPDGNTVFVTGESTGTTSGYDYATVAYNAATGAQVWVKRYNGPGNSTDDATSLAVSPTGSTVYVTGYSTANNNFGYTTIAYSAANGAQQWAQRYDPGNGSDRAFSVAVGSTGTVFVTGTAFTGAATAYDYTTIAYNPAGAQLWVKHFSGPTNAGGKPDQANAVAVSPDGKTVFVTGETYGPTNYVYTTVAYHAATGAQLWAKHNRTLSGGGDNDATSLAVSPDSTMVYVTGYIGDGLVGYGTIAYNAATGTQVWAKNYHGVGPGFNQAYSVATSPTGSTVYVTGYSATNGGSDNAYATVAYSAATGAQLWVKRYKGPGPDAEASSVTVGPTGTVFVTGESSGAIATVAYSG
jgi:WD40 repeat protein